MEIIGSALLGALFGFLLSTGIVTSRVAKKEVEKSSEEAKREQTRVLYENRQLLNHAIREHRASEKKAVARG